MLPRGHCNENSKSGPFLYSFYQNPCFKSLDGVPTGGPESGSIANIFVKWMLDKRLLQDPSITRLDRMMSRKRFLDDLWFIWRSTERAFENFKTALNNMGIQSCFTLKGEVGTTVEFLDVKMELIGGRAETSLFIKPTDSEQYLNRRSDHSTHVFLGIPYSQFRRAMTICSREDDRAAAINYIYEKFANSGYRAEELDKCKDRALQLDREEILNQHRTVSRRKDDGILTFVINHATTLGW